MEKIKFINGKLCRKIYKDKYEEIDIKEEIERLHMNTADMYSHFCDVGNCILTLSEISPTHPELIKAKKELKNMRSVIGKLEKRIFYFIDNYDDEKLMYKKGCEELLEDAKKNHISK